MKNENYLKDRNETIAALYGQGLLQKEIAIRYNMTKSNVSQILRKYGFKNGKNQKDWGK